MQNRKPAVLLWALSAILLCLCGCAGRTEKRQFFAMDTVMELTICGERSALDAAQAEIFRLDALLSAQNQSSELARLNAGQTAVSDETAKLVKRALELSRLTDGAFDPTLLPVSQAWGFFTGEYRVPDAEQLRSLLEKTGWQRVLADGNTVTMPQGFALDLGGIGKGYAAERLRSLLLQAGVRSALLSLGGNVSVIGTKPDGSAWRVAVQHPEGGFLGTVEAADECVVTSGGYQRFFERDGVRYHHILDPQTGRPAESGLSSATVVSGDDTAADALSTALFVMGAEKAEEFWRRCGGFEMILLTDDGRLLITEGLRQKFTSELPFEVIVR